MTNTTNAQRALSAEELDELEALACAASPDNTWPFNVNAFRKYLTPANTLALIAQARAALPQHPLLVESLAVFDLMQDGCGDPNFGDFQNGHGETIGPRMDALHAALRVKLSAARQGQAAPHAQAEPVAKELKSFEDYFCMTLSCDGSEGQELVDACHAAACDAWMERARRATPAPQPSDAQADEAVRAVPELTVWYGPMPESNGKSNFTATLKRKGASIFDTDSYTFQHSEYPDRVRYEADCMRYLIGELAERPDILAYDTEKHSGYVEPSPAIGTVAQEGDPIRRLIAQHADMLEENPYTYFELAYTRRTEWMAWLCSNHREADPDRKVLAKGQGSTSEEACEAALAEISRIDRAKAAASLEGGAA